MVLRLDDKRRPVAAAFGERLEKRVQLGGGHADKDSSLRNCQQIGAGIAKKIVEATPQIIILNRELPCGLAGIGNGVRRSQNTISMICSLTIPVLLPRLPTGLGRGRHRVMKSQRNPVVGSISRGQQADAQTRVSG